VYRILVEKPEYERPLGRCRHNGENSIKVDLDEIGLKVMD